MPPSSARRSRSTPLLVALAVLVAVVVLGLVLEAHPWIGESEQDGMRALARVQAPALDALALAADTVFGTIGSTLLMLALIVAGGLRGQAVAESVRMLLCLGVPWLVYQGVKLLVARPRPAAVVAERGLVELPGTFSFPSGHTMCAALVMAGLVLLAGRGALRVVLVVLGTVVVLTVAWSRVYLGVHHPSDVLASMVLAPALVAASTSLAGRPRISARGTARQTLQPARPR